jgi:16S rRNA A1518/A1519 N6-dimethyltransferase RsmA/KsgA/DIM1 with predicted DNA glycosylase/AP lyase activity
VTERTGFHPVARTVFRPPPRVDSALVAFGRRGPLPDAYARIKQVVTGAFAHRRKTLANSLEFAGVASRAAAAAALEDIGRAAGTRAEELEPEDFARLESALR